MHISGLESYVNIPAFIIKKFRCEGINRGANSGFRITFLLIKRTVDLFLLRYLIKIKRKYLIKLE